MLKKHFRPLKSDDIGFVIDGWMRSYTGDKRAVRKKECVENHRELIKECLLNHSTIICCNPEDEDQIFGFMNYFELNDLFVLNYIYTKETFKRMNVATELFKQVGIEDKNILFSTHLTESFKLFTETKRLGFLYNPHFIFKNILRRNNV